MKTVEEIKNMIKSPEYHFLRDIPHLGNNIVLLGLGGSYAYGTNIETSDVDIRGVATRTPRDILTGRDWEQSVNEATDTTIYSLERMFKLLISCNPNTLEILGLKPEHYLYVSPIGRMILDNKNLFLSKKVLNSFSGYAMAQMNRLNNKSGRALEEVQDNETRSINKAIVALRRDGVVDEMTSAGEDNGDIYLYLASKYKLENFVKLAQNVLNVHSDYSKSARNDKAVDHGKLAKHQMHLVRLFHMALDILERGEINTYREEDHDLLMDIRAGKYLIDGVTPTKEFMEMVKYYDNLLKEVANKTGLPVNPDINKIQDLLYTINEMVITGTVRYN